MGAECHVGRPSVKVPAETLGWRLTLGSEGLSRLQNSHKPAPSGFAEGWVIYPPYPMGVPEFLAKRKSDWGGEVGLFANGCVK